ncbi:MAG: US12 family protein [Nitrospirae bacterium]|nr:US12 family protein [Nitrospirota bacterium]
MRLSTGVFDSTEEDSTISDRVFYAVMGIAIIYGLLVTAGAAYYANISNIHFTQWQYLLVGVGLPLLGCFLTTRDNTLVTLIGYNLIVVPFGLVLGPFVHHYSPDVMTRATEATAVITFTMTLLSFAYPALFARLGGALFATLIGLFVVRLLQMFIPALAALTIIDWIAAGLFSLYIGYDMWRAQNVTRSVGSALNIAVQLYLDIINLFLTLTRLFANEEE